MEVRASTRLCFSRYSALMENYHVKLLFYTTDCAIYSAFAVLAFWYKPDSSHKTLYPTAKDKKGKPVEVTVNGERAYTHCEYGIEIFRT
eukprot:4768198-Pleurochrysis_carterae.AAC.1